MIVHITGFVLFWVLQIPWLFLVFYDLGFSCHFLKIFRTLLVLAYFLKQFNRNKLWYPPNCMSFTLFHCSSLSCIMLALSPAVTNLPNKTLIFHDFQARKIKFHDFPGLENEWNSRFSMTCTNPVSLGHNKDRAFLQHVHVSTPFIIGMKPEMTSYFSLLNWLSISTILRVWVQPFYFWQTTGM